MSSGRALKVGGVAVAGGIGYYLYQAGGSPKVAEKKFEHDAARLSSSMRSELPGREKEAKTEAKVLGAETGKKFDNAMSEAKETTHKVDSKLEEYRANAEKKMEEYKKETESGLKSAVDKFDKTTMEKASQAKGWFGGLFGGSK
ncbi:hypothetical protein M501DRAFT_1015222 [Patellaria atrata CBS 101060]|uniref:Calcofluor white hypersensitive protein n=1 Tax=Patellaria atrata CBS 101060 TaxID=1346257 RepID=A0A9P4SCL3_9PEZI|nr:hypothetical protein M501DRAFT_1015222 [Patellaria atrata CBS 101060]